MYEEKDDGLELWLPSGSDFGRRSRLLNKEFGSGSDGRVASLLVVAKDGGSVLSADNMRRIYKLRKDFGEAVEASEYKWSDLCQKQAVSIGELSQGGDNDKSFPEEVCESKWLVENTKYVCMESHVFEIWAQNGEFNSDTEDQIQNLSDQEALDAVNSVKISGLTGEDFSASTFLGISDKDKDANGNIKSASAMVLQFVLSYQTESKELETFFIDYFRDKDENNEYINFKDVDGLLEVYPSTARSYDDISDESTAKDQQLFLFGYLLVALYVMLMLGKFSLAEQRILLALIGMLSVILGIGTTYGLCSLFGIWGSQMNMIMPFMLLGIGIDDMFVIVQNFDTLDDAEKSKSRPERMGLTMRHGGVAITITTVTDIMAFGIGATTVLPALSHFCIYATFGIFFVYFYMITFFFGIFVLDVKRSDNMKYASLFFWRKEPQWQSEPTNFSCLTGGFCFYSKYLLKMPGR